MNKMKYEYIGTLEELTASGFYEDELDTIDKHIEVGVEGDFQAVRVNHSKRIGVNAIRMEFDDKIEITAYKYKGNIDNHKFIKSVNPTPYIQDLIKQHKVFVIKEEE